MDTEYAVVNKVDNIDRRIVMRQFLVGSISSMLMVTYGLGFGGPTVIIPQIRKEANSTDAVSDDMASWISSAISFGAIAFVIVLTALAHYIGRKKTIVILNGFILLAFINTYFSYSIVQILISQFVLGLNAAAAKTIVMMLMTEYTVPRYRGIVITCAAGSMFWGIWISNALGTFCHWKTIPLCGIACNVYILAIIYFCPESPYWLANNKRYNQCAEAHHWIKGSGDESKKELNTLIRNQKSRQNMQTTDISLKNFLCVYFNIMRDPEIYRPLLCCFCICSLYDWSGKLSCTIYSIDVIKKITNNERTAYMGMLILDGVTVLSLYLMCAAIKSVTRRTQLITATIFCIAFLLAMALYSLLVKLNLVPENNYVVIILLVGYSISVSSGPVIMSGLLYAELIPIKHRSVSFITIAVIGKITIALFLKISPMVLNSLGYGGLFLVYSAGSLFFIFMIYKYMPETKDKSLEEIAEYFRKTKLNVEESKGAELLAKEYNESLD